MFSISAKRTNNLPKLKKMRLLYPKQLFGARRDKSSPLSIWIRSSPPRTPIERLCYHYNPQFFPKDTAKEGRSCLHGMMGQPNWAELRIPYTIVLAPVCFSTYVLSCYERAIDLQVSINTICRRNNVFSDNFLIYKDGNP